MLTDKELHVLKVFVQYRYPIATAMSYDSLSDGSNPTIANLIAKRLVSFEPRYGPPLTGESELTFTVTDLGRVIARMHGLPISKPHARFD